MYGGDFFGTLKNLFSKGVGTVLPLAKTACNILNKVAGSSLVENAPYYYDESYDGGARKKKRKVSKKSGAKISKMGKMSKKELLSRLM